MTKPHNVLYLIRTWALGGSHTIIRLLMQHMPKDKFNIIVVPYDAPGSGNDDFIASVRRQGDDVAPERIPWRSRGNWFKARDAIADLIEKYEIDLVHCHDTNSNVLVGLGRDRFRCAAVASPYGWWTPRWHVQAQINHWVENHLALPKFERVYTVSQTMGKNVLRGGTPPERLRVIHTGLDLAYFDAGASRADTRAQFGFGPHDVVVGTVSRLFAEKGHQYLIEAMAQLKDTTPALRALIVGTGELLEPLRAQAAAAGLADRVVFTGFHVDLPGALRAMDLFAQPSILDEGFPTAVLEAQAAGLPVIASDIGGTWETIDRDVTGLLVPPRDVPALAAALRALTEDAGRRTGMAAAARPWIERSFTLDNMIAQMSATYQEAISDYARNHAR